MNHKLPVFKDFWLFIVGLCFCLGFGLFTMFLWGVWGYQGFELT